MQSVLQVRRPLVGTIALVVGLISLSLPTLARDAGKGDSYLRSLARPEPRVTVDVDDTDLQQALAQIFRKASVNYIIHPDVPMNKVTVDLHNQPLSKVLVAVCRLSAIPIQFEYRHGVYRIFPLLNHEPGGWKVHSGRMWVNLGVTKMRLGSVLYLIMEQFGMDFSVDAELMDKVVTITMLQPYEVALESLKKASGAPFSVVTEGKRHRFLPVGKQPEVRPFFQGNRADRTGKRINLDWEKNAPLFPALDSIMRQFKAKYTLHPGLESATLSIRLEDATLSETLRGMGKASSIPFTYEVKNGVYHITPVKK
jgi:hypothetical protein